MLKFGGGWSGRAGWSLVGTPVPPERNQYAPTTSAITSTITTTATVGEISFFMPRSPVPI